MHPVQATDAIHWAERRHQEQLAQAELNQLARILRQANQSNVTSIGLVAHRMLVAVVMALLMVALAFATI